MKTTQEYANWDGSFSFQLKDGKLYYSAGAETPPQFREYVGVNTPFACQAVRQKLVLGEFHRTSLLSDNDVVFGIKEIKHSYYDWCGDIFKDYDIEILKGTEEDVRRCFHKCVICCEECSGCGDW